MSRIYFHSEHGEAEVRGSERAMAGLLTTDLTAAAFHIFETSSSPSPIRRLLPPTSYILKEEHGPRFERAFRSWLGSSFSEGYFVLPDGRQAPVFDVCLNTSNLMGSDSVRLLTRLHAQCEIHCYVEGEDRAWLAGMIEQGRSIGILRPEMGWESVAELLRSRDDGPVVTSYSVCEQFPNAGAADWQPPVVDDEEDYDAWYALPFEQRWALALAGLRRGDEGRVGLRMQPSTWGDYSFGCRVDAFQIRDMADALAAV